MEEVLEALPSNRSVRAVQQQIIRLGLKRGPIVPTKEKNIVPTIETGEVMTRKEALKILASAIKHLQAGGKVEDIEIRRLRAVAMLVRNYFMIFDSYEKYTELKERVKKLEDVEFLVIEMNKSSISFHNIGNGLPPRRIREIENGKVWAMGSSIAKKLINAQLMMSGEIINRNPEAILEFGPSLIAYACLTDDTVGNPAEYGIDLITITQNDNRFDVEPRPLKVKQGMQWRFAFNWEEES